MKPADMNVYVAGPWKHRLVARQAAQEITDAGFIVVSRWHDAGGPWDSDIECKDPATMEAEANMDFLDVLTAHALVVLNIERSEGKAVEQGIALAAQAPVIVVGTERFNVFQYMDNFQLVPDVAAAIEALHTIPV